MRRNTNQQEKPAALKRKLSAALAMLMIATILMTTTSYAWFILSTAPEVTGIETQVGANGSLEIALLNTETRGDMSKIRSGIGDSLAANNLSANNAWGNLIDLGFVNYGLNDLVLMPARLNVSAGEEGSYTVDPGLLAVPTYGYDGRIVELTEDTTTAIYQDQQFAFIYGQQDYGVRAIGTSNSLSVQGSALANAQSNVSAHSNSARSIARASLQDNGVGLFDIVVKYAMGSTYDDTDKAVLLNMLEKLGSSLEYIDLSLRQGLVAYAASVIADEGNFTLVKDQIMDTSVALPELINQISAVTTVPSEYSTWVARLTSMQNSWNNAYNACVGLTGGSYIWDQVKPVLTSIMNVEGTGLVYIDGSDIKQLDTTALMGKLGGTILMTLAPGSGLYADIADFVDNYTATIEYMGGTSIEISTTSNVKPAYLTTLSGMIGPLEPASGGETVAAMPLNATYGYALDLAFRCNAAQPDLVLQTAGVQRVYNGGTEEGDVTSTSGSTQGGGSYMEFISSDGSFTPMQQKQLMDAVRVGFLDEKGEILAIAKPSVTGVGPGTEDGAIRAPLYLYDYTFEEDEAGLYLSMGERNLTENLITPLEQNVAKAVTVVVWLDGDIVDNTMVSATKSASLTGVMNLQFATNAELVPAVDGMLLNYTADKSGLMEAIAALAETAEAGQGTYTDVSWNAFTTAYDRAVTVNDNANAGVIEIRNAVNNLSNAAMQLTVVSKDAVSSKIEEVRTLMGTVDGETARYVVADENGGYTTVDGTGTGEDTEILGTIDSVNNGNNLNDEGNGLYTTVYSDESWNTLADALYEAEAVILNPDATDTQINTALSTLENAEKALTRQVFFKPYEYNGAIYYEAICDAENADTYGKWYDSGFQRIVADVTILNLDAYAEPAQIAEIGQGTYVPSDADYITPDIAFLDEVYPELRGVEINTLMWADVDSELFTDLTYQYSGIQLKLTGKSGPTTLGATILTQDGVVITVTKEVTIYDRADGVKLSRLGNEVESLNLTVEGTADLTAELLYEVGGVNTGDKTLDELVTERALRFTWASSDDTVASVSGKEAGTCAVNGLSEGTAVISVSIETLAGNFYTYEIPVTVG